MNNILLLLSYTFDLDYIFLYCIGFFIIIIGLFIKLGISPFHAWVADIYDGSSFIVIYILSTIPKISILLFLLHVCINFII